MALSDIFQEQSSKKQNKEDLQKYADLDFEPIKLADELSNVSINTEGLDEGQTPIRDESLSKGGRETSRFKDTVLGEEIDWERWKKAPANRKNFYYVKPDRVFNVIKKQYQRYFADPTRYGLTEESTIKDAVETFDQENPKHKIKKLKDKGIDVNTTIKEAREKFDLSKLNPFGATEAYADEVQAEQSDYADLGFVREDDYKDLGFRPEPKEREEVLGLFDRVLLSSPMDIIANVQDYAKTQGENIKKSFKRGQANAFVSQAKYLFATGKADYKDVKKLVDHQKKVSEADPIRGKNIIANAIYSVAEMIPAMGSGIIEGMGTAGTAGLITASTGVFAPLAPAMAGAGQVAGSMHYWYRQGAGDLYWDMHEKGVKNEIAKPVSILAGSLYAGIEFSQIDKLIPGTKEASKKLISDSLKKTIKKFVVKYGANWASEVGEEGLQEIVIASAEEVADNLSKKEYKMKPGENMDEFANRLVKKNKEVAKKVMLRGWEAVQESALPMLFLMGPSTIKAGVDIAGDEKVRGEVRAEMARRVIDEARREEAKDLGKGVDILKGEPFEGGVQPKKKPLVVGPKVEVEPDIRKALKQSEPEITDKQLESVQKIINKETIWEDEKVTRALEIRNELKKEEAKPKKERKAPEGKKVLPSDNKKALKSIEKDINKAMKDNETYKDAQDSLIELGYPIEKGDSDYNPKIVPGHFSTLKQEAMDSLEFKEEFDKPKPEAQKELDTLAEGVEDEIKTTESRFWIRQEMEYKGLKFGISTRRDDAFHGRNGNKWNSIRTDIKFGPREDQYGNLDLQIPDSVNSFKEAKKFIDDNWETIQQELSEEKQRQKEREERNKYGIDDLPNVPAPELLEMLREDDADLKDTDSARGYLLEEMENREETILEDLGYPTDPKAPYRQVNTGEIELLGEIGEGPSYLGRTNREKAEYWDPVEDIDVEIKRIQGDLDSLKKRASEFEKSPGVPLKEYKNNDSSNPYNRLQYGIERAKRFLEGAERIKAMNPPKWTKPTQLKPRVEKAAEPKYTVTTADIIPTRQGYKAEVTDIKTYPEEKISLDDDTILENAREIAKDGWEGNLIKEREIKLEIHKQTKNAKETERLFEAFKDKYGKSGETDIMATVSKLSTEDLEALIDERYSKGASQEELDILESEYERRSDVSPEDLGESDEVDIGLSLEEILADSYKTHFISKHGTFATDEDFVQNVKSNLMHPQLNTGFTQEQVDAMSNEDIIRTARDAYNRIVSKALKQNEDRLKKEGYISGVEKVSTEALDEFIAQGEKNKIITGSRVEVTYSRKFPDLIGKQGEVTLVTNAGGRDVFEVTFEDGEEWSNLFEEELKLLPKSKKSGILKVEEAKDEKDILREKPYETIPGSEEERNTEDVLKRTARGESVESELDRERRSAGYGPTSKVETEEKLGNYRITDADELGKGGPKEKFRNNVTAIKLLKEIESQNRKATPEEQKTLVKYVGWGGLSKAFEYSYYNDDWKNEYNEIKELLTDEEYNAAKASTISSFYTPPSIIKSIWNAVEHIGFRTGKVLDPSTGTGHFLGLAPNYKGITFSATELDPLTGRIAKQLYQHADIQITGFEDSSMPLNFYDLAITNVPFGNVKPFDRNWKLLGIPKRLMLHDFFFAKSLALLKPGGVMAFVTSKGTMDKNNSDFREYLNGKAQFLGAVRLPSNAFKEGAGTEVVTDIIFMQKLRVGEKANKVDWIDTSDFQVGEDTIGVNNYFMNNPDNILGTMGIGSGQFGPALSVDALSTGIEGLEPLLRKILPENIYKETLNDEGRDVTETEDIDDSSIQKDGSYIIKDGKVYIKEGDKAVLSDIKDSKTLSRLKSLIGLRVMVRDLLSSQLHGATDTEIKRQQAQLSKAYDSFVKRYGYINDRINEQTFWDDPDSPLLSSIEVPVKKVGKKQHYKKHDIFTKRVLIHHTKPTTANDAKEALNISFAEYGKINWEYMSELLNKPIDKIVSDLEDDNLIYKNPEGEIYETADEYLSGNVKIKLKLAQTASKVDPSYKKNAEALKKVQPADLGFDEISVKMGMTWIDGKTYAQFLNDIGLSGLSVHLIELDGSWKTTRKTTSYWDRFSPKSTANISEWGTERFPALRVFEAISNGVPIKVYDYFVDENGKKQQVLNEEQTALAEDKGELMKEKFKEWFWDNQDRREFYLKRYNEEWNNNVDRKYDGSHLVFPSMNPNAFEKGLRKTQLDAISRGISSHRLMLAHAVGSGKTAVGIATLMESKRLGLINKGMVVAQKNIIPGWRSQINQIYPSAKVLVADEKNFDKSRRKKFLSKIATGDWDIIVIPESSFEFISVSDEAYTAYVNEEVSRIREHISEMKASGNKVSVKSEELKIQKLESNLKAKLAKSKLDDFLRFEELGVDALIVDEADRYKNVAYTTKKQGIKGMGTAEGNNKTADMMMKTKIIREKNGKLIFATGTPISNSMVEVYSMMKYLQPEILEQQGMRTFDAWANTFGETETALEVDVSGGKYKMVNRFSKFVNVQELLGLLKRDWDIQTAKMLEEQGILVKGKNLPLVDSPLEKDILPIYPSLANYIQVLIDRTTKIKERKGRPQKGDDIMLTVLSDGMKATLDMRMIDPLAKKEENSKIETAIRGIKEVWDKTKSFKGTQIVFIDRVKPNKDAKFNPHYYMKDALVKQGIPAKEIAFIHDYDTEAKKTRLYEDVNDGTIRIVFGSTEKLGAGTNIQEKLHTLWHLDVPWRPRDMEQREGRIIRPGNSNKEVTVHKLVTKGSLDTFMYNILEKKASAIEQILSGRSKERIIEEEGIDEFEAIKSLSSANPLVKEKGDIDRDVRRLQILKKSFQKDKFQAEKDVESIPKQIKVAEKAIEDNNRFIDERPSKPTKETFEVRIGNKSFKDKGEAHAQLEEALRTLEPENYRANETIGVYLGYDLFVGKSFEVAKDKMVNYVGVRGKGVSFEGVVSADPVGTFTSLDNQIFLSPERENLTYKGQIAELENKLKYSNELLEKGFIKEEELQNKLKRQVEVNRELRKDVEGKEVARDYAGLEPPDPIQPGLSIFDISRRYQVPIEDASAILKTELENSYERIKDLWIGEKDYRIMLVIPSEKKKFQTQIREALGEKKYTQKVKDYDIAIQIYIDLGRNPSHLTEYYDELTPEQKRIVDMSQNLPPKLKSIADEMSASYREIGLESQSAGIIRNVFDNYVGRVWKDTELFRKFGTQTRHGKMRKLDTILEGWAKGLELQIKGSTNNLAILKEEMIKTIEDRKFVTELLQVKDVEGNPLLSPRHLEGYVRVKHPNFKAWRWVGKADEAEVYGKNVFVDDEGNLFERQELYAPEKQAKNLNNILGISQLKNMGGPVGYLVDKITKYNAVFKGWILQTSLFHHMAFARSYYLGTNRKHFREMNIIDAYKEGNAMIDVVSPVIELAVRNGLTLGRKQDWNEELLREKTAIGKILDTTGATKAVKDKILRLRENQADFLFGVIGAGLKAKAFEIEFRNQKRKYPLADDNILAKRVANLINDDFGGLHLQRMGRNPTVQHLFRLLALAPDWTESNIRSMVKAIRAGTKGEQEMYRNFWAGILAKGLTATILANIAMAAFDDDDDEGKGILARFIRNYKTALKEGRYLWLDVDITPIYRALGGKEVDRFYFSLLGHFKDPLKFTFRNKRAKEGEIFGGLKVLNPTAFKHKASIMGKIFMDYLTGVDYKGARFTTLKELLGIDEKGVYKRKTTKKGKTYEVGDPKGGQLKGQTVTWDWGGGGIVEAEQLPSFILNQAKSTQPVQVQQLMGYMAGEIDRFMAITNSLGLGVKRTYGLKTTAETIDDFKDLSYKKALEAYKNASPEMRKKFKPILGKKMRRSTSKTREDIEEYKRLLKEK